jgi:hypothetical protein
MERKSHYSRTERRRDERQAAKRAKIIQDYADAVSRTSNLVAEGAQGSQYVPVALQEKSASHENRDHPVMPEAEGEKRRDTRPVDLYNTFVASTR